MKNRFYKLLAAALLFTGSASAQNIYTIAGNGTRAATVMGDGSAATAASIGWANYVTSDASGNIYFSDSTNSVVRKIDATGTITTIAGTGSAGYGGDGGPATAAQLNVPWGLAVDPSGNVFIADHNNYCIRKIDAASGNISTYAGTPTYSLVPASRGLEGRPATTDSMAQPWGIALDATGNLYIADYDKDKVWKVTASTGIMTTAAGAGPEGFAGDGTPATGAAVRCWNPSDVSLDGSGNLYFTEAYTNCIREIFSSTGIITHVVGAPPAGGYLGSSGPATAAFLDHPWGLNVDAVGNIFIADPVTNVVFEVFGGAYVTVAGTTAAGYNGDGISATTAEINAPQSVKVDNYGNILLVDPGNYRIRRVGNHGLDVKQNEASTITMSLYPNPNGGRFSVNGTLRSHDDQQAVIEVTDMLGHQVYKNAVEAPHGRLNTVINLDADLPNGLYLLIVNAGAESSVSRFVVRR